MFCKGACPNETVIQSSFLDNPNKSQLSALARFEWWPARPDEPETSSGGVWRRQTINFCRCLCSNALICQCFFFAFLYYVEFRGNLAVGRSGKVCFQLSTSVALRHETHLVIFICPAPEGPELHCSALAECFFVFVSVVPKWNVIQP